MRYSVVKFFEAYDCSADVITPALDFRNMDSVTLIISTSGVPHGDLNIQASNDGKNWSDIGTPTDVNDFSPTFFTSGKNLPLGYLRLTFKTTIPSAGTITATMQARWDEKRKYIQKAVIDRAPINTNPKSEIVDISHAVDLVFQVILTDTAAGNLDVEVSNNKVDWVSIFGGPTPIAAPLSTFGAGFSAPFMWIRTSFVKTGGIGFLSMILKTNGRRDERT